MVGRSIALFRIMLKRISTRYPPVGEAFAGPRRGRWIGFKDARAEAFATREIERLFGNIGFSGLGHLRFALGPVLE